MLAFLQGQVIARDATRLLVQVGPVGLWVYAPQPLLEAAQVGETRTLHTSLVVRDDGWTLYGFDRADERDLFELLLGVNGVGPRVALAILSYLTPDAVRRAVHQEEPAVLQRVPGVGKKTAQRIVLALQDRLAPPSPLQAAPEAQDVDADVLAALVALGYSVVEAQAAIQHIPRDAPQDVESRLRLALQYFSP
ncbi:MAG: Holliday junction branch migration protein RuvA [Chloroflexi bacterium]|nr:Holliday junction branch migration protein RuvA [Chloroflexota bacterium]